MDFDDAYKANAKTFKAGWDKAGRDGAVSPELRKALEELRGIHPDQADHYMDAKLKSLRFGDKAPDPEDFKRPVVLPFKPDALKR